VFSRAHAGAEEEEGETGKDRLNKSLNIIA
jgi:hypothetical protein